MRPGRAWFLPALSAAHITLQVSRARAHTHTRARAPHDARCWWRPRDDGSPASAAAPLRREAATLPRRAPRSPRAPAPLLRRPTRCPPARPTRCWSRPRFSRATTSLLRQPQGRPSTPCGRGVADSGEAHACTARHAHAHARPDTRSARPAAPRPCCPSLCAYSLTDCPAVHAERLTCMSDAFGEQQATRRPDEPAAALMATSMTRMGSVERCVCLVRCMWV